MDVREIFGLNFPGFFFGFDVEEKNFLETSQSHLDWLVLIDGLLYDWILIVLSVN